MGAADPAISDDPNVIFFHLQERSGCALHQNIAKSACQSKTRQAKRDGGDECRESLWRLYASVGVAGRLRLTGSRAGRDFGAADEAPFQRGRQTNLFTPHPGPLPFEGRGRIGSPVHGLNARNLVSRNSLHEPRRKTALLSPALSSLGGGEGEERDGRFMVPIRAAHEAPLQRGRLTNLLTPQPSPRPVEGRGRIGSPVHGLNARNLVSRNSPSKGGVAGACAFFVV